MSDYWYYNELDSISNQLETTNSTLDRDQKSDDSVTQEDKTSEYNKAIKQAASPKDPLTSNL